LLLSAGACRTPSAARLWLSVNISYLLGAQQQTRQLLLLLSIDGTYRQTDTRPLHIPCSIYYVGSISNLIQKTLDISLASQRLNAVRPTCWFHATSADAAR